MNKYYFDLVGQHRSEYDYRGSVFSQPENAFRMAELMALDLGINPDGAWSGWAVKVRNAQGKQFFSVPVEALDPMAA
jgi:hypothetical protein